ncbi:efflux RND transporter periplasmic adaptor subunit [Achromobacter aloeverae]|uniref:Secretion protein HylD n=1 Tax=Achromobacter aloeverae TaxID=1750518 RepID=A0A4Q1HK94_9BURK|nr:HlyD family efflux transporter periplasmic adaptor subunit [Achromobacter aloeverae]RXN90333.1 secretion protein HylD [Achromobacter aloeverae]
MTDRTHDAAATHPLLVLLDLSRRARDAGSAAELAFMVVNDSLALAPYRQGALWLADQGLQALSGVIEPEANAPYAQWLTKVCRVLHETRPAPAAVLAADLPTALTAEWAEWLPPHGLWLPFGAQAGEREGGVLLAADRAWSQDGIALLAEWIAAWSYAWSHLGGKAGWSWRRLRQAAGSVVARRAGKPWWRQRRTWAAVLVLALLFCPVRLSVLAPGELVPANPAVIRAPVDGVVAQFQVQPNEVVKAGQLLFSFDQAPIATRLEVANQALATAQAEYRQYAQQALTDPKSKAQLTVLSGRIEEKQAEAVYARGQFERSRVTAPRGGIALFDDPSEWIGKPVQTGEGIMRIAAPDDVEVEAWLPIGDAIPLEAGAQVDLYLAAAPLSAVPARVRYVAHDAVPRPDGSYAYRVRARLEGRTDQRVGLKGTAKLAGDRVPLIYWMLRRPLATLRQHLGL